VCPRVAPGVRRFATLTFFLTGLPALFNAACRLWLEPLVRKALVDIRILQTPVLASLHRERKRVSSAGRTCGQESPSMTQEPDAIAPSGHRSAFRTQPKISTAASGLTERTTVGTADSRWVPLPSGV
jgi:hypothetical protein